MKNKKKQNKFFEIKASANKNEADVFIYGEIVSGDKWEDSDISALEFQKELENLSQDVKTLNLFINSPGGSVFTTLAMMSQLERAKDSRTINAYVDGLAASAASFLIMAADNIYMYSNSMLMIHKPMMGLLWGANANTLREKADWLDKIESSTCIPAYKSKGTDLLTDETLSSFLGEKDTWLDAYETAEYFNVTVIEETKDVAACVDTSLLYSKDNIPDQLKEEDASVVSDEELSIRQQIADEAKASEEYTKTILGGIYS